MGHVHGSHAGTGLIELLPKQLMQSEDGAGPLSGNVFVHGLILVQKVPISLLLGFHNR